MSLHQLLVKQARLFETVCDYAGRGAVMGADELRELRESYARNQGEIQSALAKQEGGEG